MSTTLAIFVLFDELLHVVIQFSAWRVLGPHNVTSLEVVVSDVDDLDLLGVGSLDLLSELGTGNVFI